MSDVKYNTPRLSEGLRIIEKDVPLQTEEYTKDYIRQNYSKDRDLSKITVIPAAHVPGLFESGHKQRVAVYCRVSTDGIQQTTSFELQRKYYLKYVQSKPDWTLVAMYSDEGITATNTTHRKGLNQMLKDAREGKFDIIVVKNLSRLSRNLMDCMNIVKELRQLPHPVGILFETENMYTLGENMDFTIQILSLVAQEESHKKSEAMTSSYKQRFEQGMYMKPDLLGYDRVGVNEIAINQEEAKTVQLIFMMYLANYQPQEIADVLTMLGRKTHTHVYKDGRTKGGEVKWTADSVKNIMKNERRCGDVLAQKTYTVDYLSHKTAINNSKLPQYYAKDQHEAIVSPTDFLIAQKKMKSGCPGWNYGLPSMEVHKNGFLNGFVTTTPRWSGFTSEDYNRASLKAYGVKEEILDEIAQKINEQEQDVLIRLQEDLRRQNSWDDDFVLFADDEEIEAADEQIVYESYFEHVKQMRACLEDSKSKNEYSNYDLRDYELVRPQYFSIANKLHFTLDKNHLVFNKNCFNVFNDNPIQEVEIIYNPVEKIMIVVPADEPSPRTFNWARKKEDGNVYMRKSLCKGIAQSIFKNMGWNDEFRYRILGCADEMDGKKFLAFFLDEPIIVVPVKKELEEENQNIIQKEALPVDTTDFSKDENNDSTDDKSQRSRAIYFDDFEAKQAKSISVSDLGNDKYNPEIIKKLIQKGTDPVEGWIYLNTMAVLKPYGFEIFPADWADSFGPEIYEREYNKLVNRMISKSEESQSEEYGWTVGLDLPTKDTVNQAIDSLIEEMNKI